MYKTKVILFLLVLNLCFLQGKSQIIDTVCIGQLSNYKVVGDSASMFNWNVTGGLIIGSQSNDSIHIQWGVNAGTYPISVIETTTNGCVGDTMKSEVIVLPFSTVSIQGTSEICEGEIALIFATNGTNYHWNTGSVNDSIFVMPISTTNYTLVASNQCTTDTLNHTLTVHQKPVLEFLYSPDMPSYGETVFLSYTGTPVISYNWYDDMFNLISTQQNTSFVLNNLTNSYIYLVATNQFGCSDSIGKLIFINNQVNIWVPNSFTPNGDGLNDEFKITTSPELKQFYLYVYNRWGELVFESKNSQNGWDGNYKGKQASEGVYIWMLEYNSKTNEKDNLEGIKKGTITLIR
ncbi:MAG: gliding motility-associated C-terminal domain-containing protein [Bacteroidetes bacterium]|nr:gliding motility-associated C-terminal domain-containing protein [Bacteroidota bacterium]